MPSLTVEDDPMPPPKPAKAAPTHAFLNLERMRTRREALGWSMDMAATRAGFGGQRPGARWNQFENGHVADPAISSVIAIANALGLTINEILLDPPCGNAKT
jgi:transcriptional regulator with XRE-family HTH domain